MATACVPLLPVFSCLKAGSITENLAFGTLPLIRGAIRVYIGEENGTFVIVERISANSKVVEPQGYGDDATRQEKCERVASEISTLAHVMTLRR
jgi:hypothetical protein